MRESAAPSWHPSLPPTSRSLPSIPSPPPSPGKSLPTKVMGDRRCSPRRVARAVSARDCGRTQERNVAVEVPCVRVETCVWQDVRSRLKLPREFQRTMSRHRLQPGHRHRHRHRRRHTDMQHSLSRNIGYGLRGELQQTMRTDQVPSPHAPSPPRSSHTCGAARVASVIATGGG